uniref:Sec20 C-terminal domain-containing protein n=1 Tax=Jaculus jaculus TaxID=51337 RepID=A0A8C5L7V6_JACJA
LSCPRLVKFDLEVKALIQDIHDCLVPLSLNSKMKEKLQQLPHRIQEQSSEKQLLLQEVENHKKQMLSNQTSWRKANLTCKMAIDNLEKAELPQGGDPLRQRKTTKESLAQTSSTITKNLMGISRMMSQQVQQSEEAMHTVVNSSWIILDVNEEFKSMSGTIQLGQKLITKYNRQKLTNKLLIFLALALFLATVLYIVKKSTSSPFCKVCVFMFLIWDLSRFLSRARASHQLLALLSGLGGMRGSGP